MSDYKQTRDAAGNVTSQYGQMLRNLDDDLVERLRSKIIAHTDAAVWMLEAADRIEELGVAYVQADHIEELEAKLEKATQALEDLSGLEWPTGQQAKRTLAELKGEAE